MLVFSAHALYTPLEEILRPLLFVEEGRVVEISSRAHKDVPANAMLVQYDESILAPGFLDLHLHGGVGVDVMRASADELPRLNQFLAGHGVTGYFPTTVAAPLDRTYAALSLLADAIEAAERSRPGGAQAEPLGIHLEGPFLSHKRRGVHPPEFLLEPTIEIFDRLWQAAHGRVRMMTIAPELPGAVEVIGEAAKRGVCMSLGHSDATIEPARAAIAAGARHATHTFNAMRPFDHRDPGLLGEVLTNGNLSADIIADGIHTAAEIVKLFLQAKGKENSVLITDAISATGMPDGIYQLGPIQVEVKDGRCTSEGRLAGSVLTMDKAVRNVTQFAGWTLRDGVRAASWNAARVAGFDRGCGKLQAGSEATFLVLSSQGEVRKTIVRGQGY
ncbi:MAG TPA: N-acetylglucosamine-6-phosphate deacetylase [Candidatus Binatia bacterium]|nr:N-acetylglucosamine-6-phosphate deacetylase [Candidatus Binatia bacterium]